MNPSPFERGQGGNPTPAEPVDSNVRKAAQAAKRKKTIAKLPKKTRTALGKQGAKVAKQKRAGRRGTA
jgi:hypothetical protein